MPGWVPLIKRFGVRKFGVQDLRMLKCAIQVEGS